MEPSSPQELQEWWNEIVTDVPSHIVDDGLYVHVGIITGFVHDLLLSYHHFAEQGEIDLHDPRILAQISILNNLTMMVNGFVAKHGDEIVKWEMEHTDLDKAMQKLQAEEFFKELFNKKDEEEE